MAFIREGIETARAALEFTGLLLLVGRIEQEGQRYFENLSNLGSMRRERETIAEQPDDGKNGVARAGLVGVEKSSHGHESRIDAGFLLRFAQGGFDQGDVARIGAAAGKRHL